MISARVRLVAHTLAPYLGSNVYNLLGATDEVLTALDEAGFLLPETPDYATHEGRVQAGLADSEVIANLRDGKKILAIKRLRVLTSCGLKEAKDAVEDSRLEVYYNRPPGW